jgi:predicted enzyme involved in methoxymalonyl-ACP biosynthesis
LDRLGDNGIIAIMIGNRVDQTIFLDTWLMSCRVIGREVEQACLNVMVAVAQSAGATKLEGVYRPTSRNAMVESLYERLGFKPLPILANVSGTRWELQLDGWHARSVNMRVQDNACFPEYTLASAGD